MLVAIATYAVTEAAFTIGILEELRGGKVNFRQCLRDIAPALPRVLLLSLLLACGGAIGIAVIMQVALQGSIEGMFLVVGVATLVVLVLIVNWWVVVPAIVVEGARPFASFGRSFVLTGGHRWGILALVLLPGAIRIGVVIPLGWITEEFGPAFEIAGLGLGMLYTLSSAMLSAVGYYYLRAEKEGFSANDVAAVFD
jgi:hypothetical protein